MSQFLQLFILIPLAAFLVCLLLPRKAEKLISGLTIYVLGAQLLLTIGFLLFWLLNRYPILDIKHLVFFKSHSIEIFIDFYFDKVTAVYAFVGVVLTLLVAIFSRTYLHRDEGFKRFFGTLLMFFLGYNFIVFAGNYETLFIGWEILGICSFLLIAFYRDRYLPVKNSLKVISVYRLGDMGLILAMWMSHHLWHQNITFFSLQDTATVTAHLQEHNWYAIFIAVVIVLAAVVKSAQLPFSSWLPRAMEGPTTSSAVFYGSLSVHLGVFLLLRTYPYWESLLGIKILIVSIGVLTSLIASSIARVQSSVKTQIAYSSITQIGLMFIEVALGFHMLALVHFAGNAFLRTYQLLVSPSVLSYLIHDMVFNFKPAKQVSRHPFITRISNTFYMLSVKEFNLDTFQFKFLWNPFKRMGRRLNFLTSKPSIIVLAILFAAGLYSNLFHKHLPQQVMTYLPELFALIGLLLVLKSFQERGNASRAWITVMAGQLFITLSIAILHDDFGGKYALIYLSGAIICSITGYVCLNLVAAMEGSADLDRFHSHAYESPMLGFIFLVCCLGLIGLPFTPTFIGMDLLFSHVHKDRFLVMLFTALSFIFIEIAVLRIYSRVFMGPHQKAYHPIAYRSS